MDFKKNIEKIKDFSLKRLVEFIGLIILISAILILLSLISYNPNDPNFIYPENQEINNILGINGSITADFLLQSVGIVAYCLPISLIFLSISILFNKNLILIVNCLFYIICYSVIGTIFLSQFYKEAYFLIINGYGGYVGNYFYNEIFFKIVNLNAEISYYALLSIFIILFLISINFKLNWLTSFKKLLKNKKNIIPNEKAKYNEEDIVISEDVQESFSFINKNKQIKSPKSIFKLPKLELLEETKTKNKKILLDLI